MFEIIKKLESFPLSDNKLEYIEKKLELLYNCDYYLKCFEDLYEFSIKAFKGIPIENWSSDDMNRWDKMYDSICNEILKLKTWKCDYCGRTFIDFLPHKCKGGFRKRKLSFTNIYTGMGSRIYSNETYLYKDKYPVTVLSLNKINIISTDEKTYSRDDLRPIKINLIKRKIFGKDTYTYKYNNIIYIFINNTCIKTGIVPIIRKFEKLPRYFHEFQRIWKQ